MSTLAVRKAESIFDQIERMNQRILHRAYEIFLENGSVSGRDLDNWIAAERELVWTPLIELREEDQEIYVNVAVPGMDPRDVEIDITPDDLLVKGETHHDHRQHKGAVHNCEFASGSLFRVIHFPARIDPNKVKAEFRNGMLQLKAPLAEEQSVRRSGTEAA